MYGNTSSLEEAQKMQLEVQMLGFPDAFIVTCN
jgi:hypothetical protein